MSSAQLAEIFRIVCLGASALTFVSVIGYFTFSTRAEREKAARLDELAATEQSLVTQVAEYEEKLRQKERLQAQMEKERVAVVQGTRETLRNLAERERAVSEQEAWMLLGEPPLPSAPGPAPEVRSAVVSEAGQKITPERYEELVAALRAVPPADVEFLFNDTDPEATALAGQLSSALAEAGFKRRVMPPPGKKFDWRPAVSGVRVAIAEGRSLPPMVPPFTRVLKKSGIQVEGVINPNVPKTQNPLVWIIIGTKPTAGGG